MPNLAIAFGPIVRRAEHLAVLSRTFAAFAPRGDVVGVHFAEFIGSALIRGIPKRTERTVGLALHSEGQSRNPNVGDAEQQCCAEHQPGTHQIGRKDEKRDGQHRHRQRNTQQWRS